MGFYDACFGAESLYLMHHHIERADAVVDEKHLPTTAHLLPNSFLQYILVSGVDDHRLNRVAISGRSSHNRQIARPKKRKLERSRNRSGG